MNIQTEFDFELPIGYVDPDGNGHKTGKMRLATAADELALINHPLLQQNEAYVGILMLARVVTTLGEVPTITPDVVQNLFVADLTYLQALYKQINEQGRSLLTLDCPHCNEKHELDLLELGELSATP